jgi:phage shock protein A
VTTSSVNRIQEDIDQLQSTISVTTRRRDTLRAQAIAYKQRGDMKAGQFAFGQMKLVEQELQVAMDQVAHMLQKQSQLKINNMVKQTHSTMKETNERIKAQPTLDVDGLHEVFDENTDMADDLRELTDAMQETNPLSALGLDEEFAALDISEPVRTDPIPNSLFPTLPVKKPVLRAGTGVGLTNAPVKKALFGDML